MTNTRMRHCRHFIGGLRSIEVNQFVHLGFSLKGNVVSDVDPQGFGHQHGLQIGSTFVKYGFHLSKWRICLNCLQGKRTNSNYIEVDDGEAHLNFLVAKNKECTMIFRDPCDNKSNEIICMRKMNNIGRSSESSDELVDPHTL